VLLPGCVRGGEGGSCLIARVPAAWLVPQACPNLFRYPLSSCACRGGTLNVARAVRLLLNDQAGAPPPSPPAPTGTGEHVGLAPHCAHLRGMASAGTPHSPQIMISSVDILAPTTVLLLQALCSSRLASGGGTTQIPRLSSCPCQTPHTRSAHRVSQQLHTAAPAGATGGCFQRFAPALSCLHRRPPAGLPASLILAPCNSPCLPSSWVVQPASRTCGAGVTCTSAPTPPAQSMA
jgi:hypothetical protein